MATQEPTGKLPELYRSEEFLAKYREVTKAPEETIQSLGEFLVNAYAEQGVTEPNLREGDPLNMLSYLKKAENKDTTALLTVMTALRADGKKIDPTYSAAFEYWGDRAIAFRHPMGCLQYTPYLTQKDDARALTAAKYARRVRGEQFKPMADLLFLNLAMQHPEAYEARTMELDAGSSTDTVQAFLAESREKGDPFVYFLCTMLFIERGVPIDKEGLKEICDREELPHLYALLTNDAIFEGDYDYAYRYSEADDLCAMAIDCFNNDQYEYYLRLLFGYCQKYLDGNIDPMYANAVEQVRRRADYENKTNDLLVVLHAAVASARKSGVKQIEEHATESYSQVVAMSLMSRTSLNGFPKLEDPVDLARLRQAIWCDGTETKRAADLGTVLQRETADGYKIKGYIVLRDGVDEDGELVYRTRVSIPCGADDGEPFFDVVFDAAWIRGKNNLIGTGAIRSASLDRTAISIGAMLDFDNEVHDVDLTAEIDLPLPVADQITMVEITPEDLNCADGYCTMVLKFGFAPYYEDYEGSWDDYDDAPSHGEEDGDLGGDDLDEDGELEEEHDIEDDYDLEDEAPPIGGPAAPVSAPAPISAPAPVSAPPKTDAMKKRYICRDEGVEESEIVCTEVFSFDKETHEFIVRRKGLQVTGDASCTDVRKGTLLYKNIAQIKIQESYGYTVQITDKDLGFIMLFPAKGDRDKLLRVFEALKGELYREVPDFDPRNIFGSKLIGSNKNNPYEKPGFLQKLFHGNRKK